MHQRRELLAYYAEQYNSYSYFLSRISVPIHAER